MFTYTKISKYLSAKYYQDYKERLQKKKKLLKNVSLSKQEKKRQYGLEQYKNLFQELIEYRKENYKIWK